MLLSKILAVASLAATAVASGASIVTAIDKITNSSIALNSTVATWNGNLLTAIPITKKSTALLIDIKKATKVAKESEPLEFADALGVASATQELVVVTQHVLKTIVAAKSKFERIGLAPAILLTLELQRASSEDFSEAVIAKLPEQLRATAEELVKPISDAFAAAIKAYDFFKNK